MQQPNEGSALLRIWLITLCAGAVLAERLFEVPPSAFWFGFAGLLVLTILTWDEWRAS